VHRYIKPENILIQEGEAMLTDFGIALAVKEAGGNRLTQTGLSLGTPQYMSPEQATGDRGIDARSDVYSLASVLYERLAGEPPVTGASAQSMIAKLMTERPTHLRVLRDTVPLAVDEAVAKALAKTPADRFASAGDFARALDAKPAAETPRAAAAQAPKRRTSMLVGVAVLALAAIAAGGVYAMRAKPPAHTSIAALGQKTQLTLSGNVLVPAISPDGKQLAYVVKRCASNACAFSVVIQDVGGSTTRSVLDGAASIYALEWSPDRRNLDFQGTFGGRVGTYLLSALGGTPKFLTGGIASFYAGGDSLLMGPPFHPDSAYWIRVAGLDGVPRDSFRVEGVGQGIGAISAMPGADWIVSLVLQQPHGLWLVTDRHGKVVDHVVNACTCGGVATVDAAWLARAGGGTGESIVRIALDRATGKLATHQDTMATGLFTNFSLTSDGAGMVMDEGTFDFSVYALDMADVIAGRYPEARRVARASNPVNASISPDGSRLLVQRRVPTSGGHADLRFSLMPFAGGTEAPLPVAGVTRYAIWSDSVTVAVATQTPSGLRLAEVDVRSGTQRNTLDLPDSTLAFALPLRDGWAWIPASGDRVIVKRGGKSRTYQEPKWYAFLFEIAADSAEERLYVSGSDVATGDSVGVSEISLADGSTT
ncbi:MAG: protein kinase domain-containing protein, partial [Gemmatimonadaceae bacterium]